MSASGVLAYSNSELENLKDNLIFNQIKTNIGKFIGEEQFRKSRIHDFDWLEGGWFSIKDINIYKDQIFVSYTREVRENCWNTSLLHGKMNLKLIIFENLFTSDECVHFYDNVDSEFNAHQSGGRIINVNDNTLLFSIGDFRSRFRAQDKNSIFSKILEINKQTDDYKVISMGHRNPQGLFFDSKNNILLEAEHGPEGGDEINLIELNQQEIPNYGWAISSYGEHYGGKNAAYNKKKYIKYPLHKSHTEYGFIEPLIYFDPSIGISQIIGLNEENKYVVASMKEGSLYFFEYNYNGENITSPNKVINGRAENIEINRVHIGERIRDMIYYNEKLYLYLEDTASLAEVSIN
jgi:glucose/arabinose dehydrogenase